ncbi:MAG: hypothetical protein RLZZ324_77 [Candidatus Parcubacteria bacterium]
MQLIGHSAVGVVAIIALGVTNPALAFFVGWASHYVADFVPHGDEGIGEWANRKDTVKRIALVAGVDALATLALLGGWAFARHGMPLAVLAAALGAWVPDGMWGLEMLTGRKLFGPHHDFHHWNHNRLKIMIPTWIGIPAQLALTAVLWWWLMARA